MLRAYPKIFAIGTDYIRDIFRELVEITEKIDGSQFVFGKIKGELYLRSKGQQLYPDNPEKMFKHGIDYVFSIQERIPDDTVFYCEYLKTRRHNTLTYERIPHNHLMLFGMSDITSTVWTADHGALAGWAHLLDIEVVRRIYEGTIASADILFSMLKETSALGGTEIEGVVVKNYERKFLLGGQPMPLMAGKFVSEQFKEVHKARWGSEEKGKGRFTTFCESFKTEARWEKAIQHLAEHGELENEPRDIGRLLKEINQDIEAEEKETIKEWLWKENKGDILRTATRGFPEWYKQRLMERSFES